MNLLQHFNINLEGNDYFVTDIHGCYHELQRQLNVLGFDESKDRLFSGGDLVDRGPQSRDFPDWLAKPWFHSVRGNHDQMVIDSVFGGREAYYIHAQNGGTWFFTLPEVEQQCMAILMQELPLAIEIDTQYGLVGIVHAESPFDDWTRVQETLSNPDLEWYDRAEGVLMWARNKINRMDTSEIRGLYRLYVGHTPNDEVVVLGNVHYMDTGACFKKGKMTIVKIN